MNASELTQRAVAVPDALPALRLTDLVTGEFVELTHSLTVEDAYAQAVNCRAFLSALAAYTRALEAAIEADMAEGGADERLIGNVLYQLKAESSWVVEPARMKAALTELLAAGIISQQDFAAAYRTEQPEPIEKFDNRVINDLTRHRGRVAEANLNAARQKLAGAPKLSIKRVEAPQ